MELRLGDVATLPVVTEQMESGTWVARAPQWPGQRAEGVTEADAISRLQYRLEWEMAQGRVPVLQVSP